MNIAKKIMPLALAGTFALGAVVPQAVSAQTNAEKRQKNKNDWRNAAAAAAAVAGYGLLKGDKTATVLGAAGAGYSAYRYEKERKSQDQMKRERQYYYRNGRRDPDYERTTGGRKYYTYQGHRYYMDLSTGERHLVD